MKPLLTKILFLAATICLFSISVFAQNVTYLDENYKPATVGNYTYKRVIKYKEPIINPNIGTGYYGGITANPQPSGLHICTLTDYYKTGEPALIVNVVTLDLKCSEWAFDGQAVAYYKNGNIKRKESWKVGKLNGVVIFYNEDGAEAKREEYVNGKLIEEGKFSAPADSPLIGTWKFVEYYDQPKFGGVSRLPPTVKQEIVITFSSNGVLDATFRNGFSVTSSKSNWKYTAQTSTTGMYELFTGDEMIFRGSVRWMDQDTFEETVVFSNDPNFIGMKKIYHRVSR